MSHGEYTKEDSRKDLSASLLGLLAGVVWVGIVAFVAFEIAMKHHAG
jgi:hypothetical protein